MKYEKETRCIHGERDIENRHPYGAIATPIYQTATFSHPGIGESTGYDYSRESNPTRTELEKTVSSLEGAVDTVACSSGMAAIALCMDLFDKGSHIICTDDLYGGSVRIFGDLEKQKDMEFTYVDTSYPEQVEGAIRENTKALYIETPSNPMMKVTDLEKMHAIAKEHQLLLVVDNTFLTPYFQRPIELGADLVVHSGTKFLGGHNDTLAGFLCTSSEEIAQKMRFRYKTVGYALAPFDSFLILRGIKTLAVRLKQQQENAMQIAAWLKEQEKVQKVYYVGLPEHPGYETNKNQSTGSGSMISFRVDTKETAHQILEKVKLIAYAESLGGVESLITYPRLQTHGDLTEEARQKLGITEELLRMSVGIENVNDLIADLQQALE